MPDTTDHSGISHGSLKSNLIGLILSIILTVIPFAMVMRNTSSHAIIFIMVIVSAIIQIIVHLFYFLHINNLSEARWNLVTFLFTILIISIIIVGSIWIMYNLNINMIPSY